jgi:periplasmic divalent cation tolerance protein
MSDYLQVSTTTESREAAVTLARSEVGAKLAASAQVFGPVTSVFWHLGELGEGEEWQVLLKTTVDRYADLEAHLIENHPWQNPEITAVPLVAGSASYFAWLRRTTTRPDTGSDGEIPQR